MLSQAGREASLQHFDLVVDRQIVNHLHRRVLGQLIAVKGRAKSLQDNVGPGHRDTQVVNSSAGDPPNCMLDLLGQLFLPGRLFACRLSRRSRPKFDFHGGNLLLRHPCYL